MSSASQRSLFEESRGKRADSGLHFELKPYLQPFEKILARAELSGLLEDIEFEKSLEIQAPDRIRLNTATEAEVARRRVAYWQRIGDDELITTSQVLLEATGSSKIEGRVGDHAIDELPSRRILRYGPHDLHEYRGKFFPQLVRSLINFAGLTEDSVVIDPFCGSGTSLVEARLLGMQAIGMDLNPLSVLISQTKAGIIGVDPDKLEQRVRSYLRKWPRTGAQPSKQRWDDETRKYLARWFADTALEELDTLLREIETVEETTVYEFFRVILSNIIRSVSWQKKSDLRVRKEKTEYAAGEVFRAFADEAERQLDRLIPYLRLIDQSSLGDFAVYEADTRNVASCLDQYRGRCDLIITSPPYATALPYIDTDRLSLMILGLMTRGEQRERQRSMIGNREITKAMRQQLWEIYLERKNDLPASVSGFIDSLAEDYHTEAVGFRRRNLPTLLGRYFLDMRDSMASARRLLKPGHLAFFVVGNNFTRVDGSKRVIPTDEFIWEIGAAAGWHREAVIDMEMLPSRDIFKKNTGSSEKILVFRSTVERKAIYSSIEGELFDDGRTDWDFADADTQSHLHVIHPYPARFIPQIPRKAIKLYTEPGDVTLDPFAGCGTTALESVYLQRPSIAVDNNAVANLITEAKVARYGEADYNELRVFIDKFRSNLPDGVVQEWVPSYRNFEYWFDSSAIEDLSRIRGVVEQLSEPSRKLALAVFSSIIVAASRQDSDTRYTRTDREYRPGSAIASYESKLRECVKRVGLLIEKKRSDARVHLADARELEFIGDQSVNLIVTSPPYLNAYDYHKYHRHRLQWIGGDVAFARDRELGKHDTYTRPNADPDVYFRNMRKCFDEWHRVLCVGGRALVVIGDAIVGGQAVPVADRLIQAGNECGLELEKHWTRAVPGTQKSFNRKSRISEEHMILFARAQV